MDNNHSGTVESRIRAIINSKASTDAKVATIMQIIRRCEEQSAGEVLLELNREKWHNEKRKSDTGSTESLPLTFSDISERSYSECSSCGC